MTPSRIQFGAPISFHYIHPPLRIGLGVVLLSIEGLWLKTRNPLYHHNAASSHKTLGIMRTIALIGVPIVLAYTVSIYWIYRGKVKLDKMSY